MIDPDNLCEEMVAKIVLDFLKYFKDARSTLLKGNRAGKLIIAGFDKTAFCRVLDAHDLLVFVYSSGRAKWESDFLL
jgi:hypothetical protein